MKIRNFAALILSLFLVVTLLPSGTILAQSSDSDRTQRILQGVNVPQRDASDLAARLGGLADASALLVEPAPVYEVGDRQSFFVGHTDENLVFLVDTVLAAATPGVYLWVEEGVDYDADALAETARYLDDELFPAVRALFGSEATPGIDSDPHIYVVNVTGVGDTIGGYFNDTSVYPQAIFETSNQHEMFVVAVDNIPLDTDVYRYVLAHEFVHMIQHNVDDNEQTWVNEGTAELGAFLTVEPRTFSITQYLNNPTIQLNAWDIDQPTAYYGGAALFFAYLVERFGEEVAFTHAHEAANGIAGIERTLATLNAIDPATGEALTFSALFADWLAANLLNDPALADGRFGYTWLELGVSRAALAMGTSSYPDAISEQSINQYGAHYIQLGSASPQNLTVTFTGSDLVRVVPTDAHSGTAMYWANRTDQSNARLTRAFDLSAVEEATLNYWTWFEMEPFWDYGYISVSVDDGATWTVVESEAMTGKNPNSRAFANGFTGFSIGGTESRPAPFMGITYDASTAVVGELVPDTGAEAAGILPGDRLLALDGVPLEPAQLVQRLNEYHVGDTVVFTIQRADSEIELPVTLGQHPERELLPVAEWMPQSIDLTPYTGGEVLVRFDFVTDQTFTRSGWLIDDISIPEIGYSDDAEDNQGGWVLEGWARIENMLPQQFLVQSVSGPELSVERLLMPGDGTTGTWTIPVGPDAPAFLIVSGMTQYTQQPGTYRLSVDVVE